MKTYTRFLPLLGILAAIGCQATVPAPSAKAPTTPAVAQAPRRAVPATHDPLPLPPLSLFNDDTPMGWHVTSEPRPTRIVKIEFQCVVTGAFNLSPSGDQLSMETWCVESRPANGVRMMQVEDTTTTRLPGKHVFRILFRDANISVRDLGEGQREVVLNYRDPQGTSHKVVLSPQQGGRYEYSFADVETIEPVGEIRVLEVQQ